MAFGPGVGSPTTPTASISYVAVILIGIYLICAITLLILLIDFIPRICNWLKNKKHTAKLIIETFTIIAMTIVVIFTEINDKNVLITTIKHIGYLIEELISV